MNNRGYTILEFLIVGTALIILLNVLAAIMVTNNRLSIVGNTQLARLEAREYMGSQFTQTVHQAARIDDSANGETLIVENADGETVIIEREGDYLTQRKVSNGDESSYRRFQRAIATHEFRYGEAARSVELRVVFADDPNGTVHTYFAVPRVEGDS